MNTIRRFFFVFMIVGLIAAVVIPYPVVAATGTSKLTIDNKTGKVIYLKLSGTAEISLTLLPGKTEKEIGRGKYNFTYEACGKTIKGVLKATGTKSKLKIAACPTSKIIIRNNGSTNLNLRLSGPENYSFTVGPNSIARVTIIRGSYKYTAYFCGGTKTGSIEAVRKSYRWMFWCG